MKEILGNVLVALTISWPGVLPASNLTAASPETVEFVCETIPIKYANASDLAILLKTTNRVAQPLFTRLGKRLTQMVGGEAIQCELEKMGSRHIAMDERSNSLLVCAIKRDLIALKQIIATLDFALPQILVEAVIIEFQQNDSNSSNQSEIPTGPRLTALSNLGIVAAKTSPFRPTNTLAKANSDPSYIATLRDDLDAIVSALATNPAVKILQRPRIQTSEGVPAEFFVGASRPYPNGGAFNGYSSIQAVNIGWTLEVNCLRSIDDLVQLEVNETTESANGSVNIANVGTVPITGREERKAQIMAHDGETFAIAGFLETNKAPIFSKFEFLDHVPGGDYANKLLSYPKRTIRSKLVFLMRITVLPEPKSGDNKLKNALPSRRTFEVKDTVTSQP